MVRASLCFVTVQTPGHRCVRLCSHCAWAGEGPGWGCGALPHTGVLGAARSAGFQVPVYLEVKLQFEMTGA